MFLCFIDFKHGLGGVVFFVFADCPSNLFNLLQVFEIATAHLEKAEIASWEQKRKHN